MIDWSACEVVERVPGKVSGQWIVKGTRIPVESILDNAADGFGPEDLAEMFPGLPADAARRVIEHARQGVHAHPA